MVNVQVASLILRAAKHEDSERLLAFYKGHPDQFLLPRPWGEFETAIERGQFFLIVNDEEEIVAASGVFDYEENQPFVELAETYVSKSVRGYGLQSIFFKVRIASVIVYQGPSVRITTAVDNGNTFSLQTTIREGFESWTRPIPSAYANCQICPSKQAQRACCCDFYLLPVSKARNAVSSLLDETGSGVFKLKNNKGRTIELRYECTILMGELRKTLGSFVAGDTW